MVGNGYEDNRLLIIREKAGVGTGDRLWQTADGRWWKNWDGTVKTGEEVRRKIDGRLY